MNDAFVLGVVRKSEARAGGKPIDLARLIEDVGKQRQKHGTVAVSIGDNGDALLSFRQVEAATGFADALLTRLTHVRSQDSPGAALSLSIHMGPENDMGLPVAAHELAKDVAQINEIVIVRSVYERLPWHERDAFGPEERVQGHYVRRRFATGVDPCFVISPIGAPESAERERADFVFDSFIKHACSGLGLRPFRSDQEFSSAVRRDLMRSIGQARVVVSYLGSPPWNPNVMLEIGYRLATGGAIVLLRDSPKDSDHDEPLPFDITDMQILHLPSRADELTPDKNTAIIADIVRAIDTATKEAKVPWSSHHPFAQIEFQKRKGDHIIREATEEAHQLFACDRLVGAKITEVIGGMRRFIANDQFLAFAQEQDELIRTLTGVSVGLADCRSVTATIPMVFEGHPNTRYDQKAFLPIIVKHQGNANDDRLLLNVLYLDVTSATRIHGGKFVCRLEQCEERFKLVWDNYAVSYDRILPKLSFYRDAVARHVQALSSDAIGSVLDMGCGSGNVTIRLLRSGKRVTAVDRSGAMLELLRGKVLDLQDPSCLILERPAEALPFRDATFDAVNILLALFAMDKPRDALNQAIRVLKPGGTLVVTEPKRTFSLQPLLDAAHKELDDNGEFAELESDWNRVMVVNRRIDPQVSAKLPAERIGEILEREGFTDITRTDSHLGYCQTIKACKPQ